MYFNIFSHWFVIRSIIESQGFISSLSVYVYVKGAKEEGFFLKRAKAYKEGT